MKKASSTIENYSIGRFWCFIDIWSQESWQHLSEISKALFFELKKFITFHPINWPSSNSWLIKHMLLLWWSFLCLNYFSRALPSLKSLRSDYVCCMLMALLPWLLLRVFQVRMLPFSVVTLIARKGTQLTSFAEWLLMKLISLHYSTLIHLLRNKVWRFLALNSLHIQRWPWSSDLPSAEITGPCHHTWFVQCWGPNSGPCLC